MKKYLSRRQIEEVLKILCQRIESIDNWSIGGGAARILYGLNIPTEDIDIDTGRQEAYIICRRLRNYVVKPVMYSRKGPFCSHLGVFLVNGVKVEVIGELEVNTEIGRYVLRIDEEYLRNTKNISIGKYSVKLTPLEHSYIANILLERWSIVENILDFWLSNPQLLNTDYLDKIARETFGENYLILRKKWFFRDILE